MNMRDQPSTTQSTLPSSLLSEVSLCPQPQAAFSKTLEKEAKGVEPDIAT